MSSSSPSIPRFLTFVAQHDNATDEFNQPSCITMQVFTTPHLQIPPGHGTIFFGRGNRSDEGIWSPHAKFEVQTARTQGMVHIRSCFNQKYIRASSTDNFIEATADEPEEDISKLSCTLFTLTYDNKWTLSIHNNNRQRLLRAGHQPHSHNGIWLRYADISSTLITKVYPQFDLIELDMLPTLPPLVCFKADNNRYLHVSQTGNDLVIRATFTGNDRREREAQFKVVPTRLRSVVLVPMAFPDTYIVRESNQSDRYVASNNRAHMRNALLKVIKLSFVGSTAPSIAFRSLAHPNNHLLVRRVNDNALTVSARDIGLVAQAEFLIEDTVRSRQLNNIQFLYDDMKMLDPTTVAVLTKNVVNGSTVSTQEAQLAFKYSEYLSSHWETTHSWQVGLSYNSTVTASARLPVLKFIRAEASVSVELEAGYQGEHIVGETKVEETVMSTSFTLQVPPRTQSYVNMVVSRAKVQLPFTYTQWDMLDDGTTVSANKIDGLYEGEATHVDYQVEEQKL
ncbi:hypothetical protein LINPERPRIM_LOCUS2979 [Linum perenne]